MPYINENQRPAATPIGKAAADPGELNFQLTVLVSAYLERHRLSYNTINDIVGALEGAKLEFYRRVAVPYEDTKIDQNGDVYPS